MNILKIVLINVYIVVVFIVVARDLFFLYTHIMDVLTKNEQQADDVNLMVSHTSSFYHISCDLS